MTFKNQLHCLPFILILASLSTYAQHDGQENTFYLIVKDSIKVLNYYEPEYFEECGPANIQRQNAIRTKVEILAIF